ncbi:hypothetical protein N5B55_05100 [Ralstonia pickettii]|uniref:hypothetical protein n=1 Tax=Ralstonia pickettii TaxID=329 RepID=UPI002714CBD5|nr:hypothetical protein [Ralstonia pickettii]WKZ86332.1 hypothetical protein N5B55_05100 [Ralstonia pickettii]
MSKATKTTTAPKSKYARLTPKQWAEAEALWESGEVTLDDLAARFGKNRSVFSNHFAKTGITKGSKSEANKRRVAEEVAKAAISDSTVLAARIKETKEEHYKMATALAKLTWNEILQAKNDARPFSTAMNNLKALDNAMTVLKKAREERYAVLGLDRDDAVDENGLPELVISELTAEQVEALRSRDEDDIDTEVEMADESAPAVSTGEDDIVQEGD